MEQDLRRLLYRNAELEAELRLVKEQLAQAHQANTYLLGRMSIARVPYQTSSYLPSPHFAHGTTRIEPRRGFTDLLSFDEAHDSGYYDSPHLAPSVATTAKDPLATPRGREPRGRAAAKELEEKSKVPEQVEQNLIDHGDSSTSPTETPPPQPDFTFLRSRPIKHSVGLGILNARKASAGCSRTPDDDRCRTNTQEQEGFTITRKDGTKIWVPTGDGPSPPPTPKVKKDEQIPTQEQAEPQPEISQPPPTAPIGPANNPYRNPYPRPNNLLSSRWAPYNDPNNHHRSGSYNSYQRPGIHSTKELFSLPSNPEERDLYRTVLITNIPTTTEIAKILSPVQGNLAGVIIVKTAGMKTLPPMETNAAILTFENCVAALRFVGKCNDEKPYEFEANVNLARTGVNGEHGRQKWEGFADRRPPPPTPLWLQIDAQGGFEGRGRAPMMRGDIESRGDMAEVEREEEAMMREG